MDNTQNIMSNRAEKFVLSSNPKTKFALITFCFDFQAGNLIEGILYKNKITNKNIQKFIDYINNDNDKLYDGVIEGLIDCLIKSNLSYRIFFNILDLMIKKYKKITVYGEPIYIDRIHRDSFYSYYSENHIEISRYCKRLLFFIDGIDTSKDDDFKYLEERFLGSMVIRPLKNGFLGRTLITPCCLNIDTDYPLFIRLAKYKVNYMGMEFNVEAFPFLTQDGIVTTCAETSILVMMDYYSNKYNDYRFAVPSDISKIAEKTTSSRVVPSLGLNYEVMSKILCNFGFFTTFHHSNKLERMVKMRNYLYYYVESGMPICINLSSEGKGHAVVCIGHKEISIRKMLNTLTSHSGTYFTSTASGCEALIVIDDNIRPYSEYVFTTGNKNPYIMTVKRNDSAYQKIWTIDCFIAPLHKRMNMNAARAEQAVLELIKSPEINPCKYFKECTVPSNDEFKWGDKNNPLIYRLFLASSRHYRKERIEKHYNETECEIYKLYCLKVPLPQFVWVCELYDKEGYENNLAVGEIIIDATANPKANMLDSILMINYTAVNSYFARDIKNNSLIFGKITEDGKEIVLENGNELVVPKTNDLILYKYNWPGFKLKGYTSNLSACDKNKSSSSIISPSD